MSVTNKKKSNQSFKFDTAVKYLVEKLPGLIAVYLHGSAAKGELRQESDFDFALLFEYGAKSDAKTLFLIKPEVEELTGRTVDLGILSTENPVFAKEVVSNGQRLFCSDLRVCEQFEMYTFSFYAKLNDERKEILDSYQRSNKLPSNLTV